MRFVKTVARKRNHDIKNLSGVLFCMTVFNSARNKLFLLFHKNVELLFSHGTAEHICTTKRESRNYLGNLHYLFLVNHYTVGFFKQIFQRWVRVFNCFGLPFSFYVFWNIVQRSRSVQRIQSYKLFYCARFTISQNLLHSGAFKLEYCNRVSAAEKIKGLFIIFRYICGKKFRSACRSVLVYNCLCITDKRKGFESKVVKLYKAAWFNNIHGVLHCNFAGFGILKYRRPVWKGSKTNYHSRGMKTGVAVYVFQLECKFKKLLVTRVVLVRNKLSAVWEFFAWRFKRTFECSFRVIRNAFFEHVYFAKRNV